MLKMFKCKRCEYETDIKCNLITHLNKIKTCDVIDQDIERDILIEELTKKKERKILKCENCDKCFGHISSKYRHEKICKKEENIIDLKDQVKQLTQIVEKLQMTSSSNITNITNNQQNIMINLNSFSRERIDHITPEFIKNCLKEMNMIRLLEQVHFDPEHPENHTVRVKNMNKNLLEYHQDGRWIIGNKDQIIEDMINCSGYRILKTFYRNNKEEIEEEINDEEDDSEKIIKEIDNWLTKIDKEDQKLFKELKSNIFLVILNNKAMVCTR